MNKKYTILLISALCNSIIFCGDGAIISNLSKDVVIVGTYAKTKAIGKAKTWSSERYTPFPPTILRGFTAYFIPKPFYAIKTIHVIHADLEGAKRRLNASEIEEKTELKNLRKKVSGLKKEITSLQAKTKDTTKKSDTTTKKIKDINQKINTTNKNISDLDVNIKKLRLQKTNLATLKGKLDRLKIIKEDLVAKDEELKTKKAKEASQAKAIKNLYRNVYKVKTEQSLIGASKKSVEDEISKIRKVQKQLKAKPKKAKAQSRRR